jgi:hypothetical protein
MRVEVLLQAEDGSAAILSFRSLGGNRILPSGLTGRLYLSFGQGIQRGRLRSHL